MNRFAALSLMLALAGCDKQTPTPVEPTQTTAPAPAQTIASAPEPAAPTPATIAAADVQALLDAWLASQNAANFDAYAALYAPKFEGIKRVGSKKSSFDHDGWLADRKRMFAKKVEVSATDVVLTTAGRSAVVQFTQTWASGNFKDVGPKQLVVVMDGDSLRIAREEMLSSDVVGSDPSALPPYEPARTALVVAPKWVVLQTNSDGVKAAKPTLIARTGAAIARVDSAPDGVSKFVGTSFMVHGTGPACTAKVTSLHVLARATPHFGQISYWNGEEEGHPRMSDAAVAKEIYDLAAREGHAVVGELDKECPGGGWAHAEALRPEAVMNVMRTTEWNEVATEKLRGLAGYKAIQKDYVALEKKKQPWDSEGSVTVTVLGDTKADFVAVSARAGSGCNEFSGEFWALFEVSPSGDLVLMTDPNEGGPTFDPVGATRTGGRLMFFSDEVILEKVGSVWRPTQNATVPYYDCPC